VAFLFLQCGGLSGGKCVKIILPLPLKKIKGRLFGRLLDVICIASLGGFCWLTWCELNGTLFYEK